MQVKDLMTPDVVTVAPETTLKEVANILVEHSIGGVPVVAAGGKVVGVVSESDILWKELRSLPDSTGFVDRLLESAYGDDKRARATTAGEAMSSPAITIEPDAPVARAARLMLEYMINRVPVVSDGRLVGILARFDLVRAFRRPDEEIERDIRRNVLRALWIDAQNLVITVNEGNVVVAGEVENQSAATSIERWIGRVPGVTSVCMKLGWPIDQHSRRKGTETSHLVRHV